MRYRIKNYEIPLEGKILFEVNDPNFSVEDIRLIVNETQNIVICSSLNKGNITDVDINAMGYVDVYEIGIHIRTSVCKLNPTDKLTIEIDKGDNLDDIAKEATLASAKEEIIEAVNNAKPEIDLTGVARQGDNPEATNSKIYDAVKGIPDLSLLYAARAEKNDDGVNTYSIVLPVTAKVTYDDNGVATIQL